MKAKPTLSDEDKDLFKEAMGQVKRIKQDKITPPRRIQTKKAHQSKIVDRQQAEFHFSDEFEPDLPSIGPMKYVREDTSAYEAKNLRRGIYHPDLLLDLHGLDQHNAKKEIAALLKACQKEHARCVCIMHGIGNRILKNKVPHWLVQHPDVLAFHQAPLEYGGDGALLVLVDVPDKF